MNPETPTSGPTPAEITFSGSEIEVTTEDGVVETVRVRVKRMREFESGMKFASDEHALVDWFCDKPPGWNLTLHPSSYNHLVEEGLRINADFFVYSARVTAQRLTQFKMVDPVKYNALFDGAALGQSTNSFRRPL